MKRIIKSRIFAFILGAIIFESVGVIAANYAANQVAYNKNGKETVADALDGLYDRVPNAENIDRFFVVQSLADLNKSNSYKAIKNGKIIITIAIHTGEENVDSKSSYSVTKNNTVVSPTYANNDTWNRIVYYIIDVKKDDVINYSISSTKVGMVNSISLFTTFISN